MPSSTSNPIRAACLAACVLLAGVIGGCNILGPAGYFIVGPQKLEALHTLDPDRTTVVFVDDRNSRVRHSSLRRDIAQAVEEKLLEERAVEDLLSSQAVFDVVSRDRFGKPRSIAAVGREIGADVVIYVTIDTFNLSPDGYNFRPAASARVKIVDTQAGTRAWPDDPAEWHPIAVTLLRERGEVPTSLGQQMAVYERLAERLGEVTANTFVEHRPPDDSRVGS